MTDTFHAAFVGFLVLILIVCMTIVVGGFTLIMLS